MEKIFLPNDLKEKIVENEIAKVDLVIKRLKSARIKVSTICILVTLALYMYSVTVYYNERDSYSSFFDFMYTYHTDLLILCILAAPIPIFGLSYFFNYFPLKKELEEKLQINIKKRISSENETFRISYYFDQYLIPANYQVVNYFEGFEFIDNLVEIPERDLIVWVDEKTLNFADNFMDERIGKISVHLDDVISFSREGDFFTLTDISGDHTLIKTTNTIVDKRNTILEIRRETSLHCAFFSSSSYDTFLTLIPEKDIRYRDSNISSVNSISDDVFRKIEKLAELKNCGAISEDEFNEKKKEMLSRI